VAIAALPRGDCNTDARRLLEEHGYKPDQIVAVHVDAILWLNFDGKPHTTRVTVQVEPGDAVTRSLDTSPGFVA
jgi:hypothetical protein